MRIFATALLALVMSAPAFASHPSYGYQTQRPVVVVDYDVFDHGYRAAPRAGFVWVDGYYADCGDWVPGYYRPTRARRNHAWVPGYWSGGRYIAGYWRVNARPGQHWVRGYYQGRNWVSGYWAQGYRSPSVRYTRYRRPVTQPRYVGTYRPDPRRGRVVTRNQRSTYRPVARPVARPAARPDPRRPATTRTNTTSSRPAATRTNTNSSRPSASNRPATSGRSASSRPSSNSNRPARGARPERSR